MLIEGVCVYFQVSVDSFDSLAALLSDTLTVSFLIDPDAAHSLLDRGPPADDADAAQAFRQFWGDGKSNLRRFMDGGICEAVVWGGDTVCRKRDVLSQIIPYILKRCVCRYSHLDTLLHSSV